MIEKKNVPFGWQLIFLSLSRLLLNTAHRMLYPFLPFLARGLMVAPASISYLIAVRSLAGLISPFLSPLSERFGRRPLMVTALLLFAAGSFVVVIWPAFWPLGVTLVVIAVAKVIYDPTMQSYLGDVVPYRQRGRAIAVTEFAWAGALLVGVPIIGVIIGRFGWQSPFLGLGLLALGAALLLRQTLPGGPPAASQTLSLRRIWRVVREHPVIWAVGLYIFLLMTANELLWIVYGQWMEASFELSLTNLGLATAVIGSAELIGEILAGWSVDRFGKRPVVITTGLLSGLSYLLLPSLGLSLTSALVTLFLLFLAFETTVVGSIPLITEVVPHARSVALSVMVAAFSVGRTAGALGGQTIYEAYGLRANAFGAAIIAWIGALILILWIREGSMPILEESGYASE